MAKITPYYSKNEVSKVEAIKLTVWQACGKRCSPMSVLHCGDFECGADSVNAWSFKMREAKRDEARYIVNNLLTSFKRLPSEEIISQWDYLSAAHIVGQADFLLHSKVHLTMLQLALRQRNWSEILGQMFRLSLVPIGHLFHRLPLGNSGRSNVNAFKTMSIEPNITRLIESASHTSS